jgi:hypothetical protein
MGAMSQVQIPGGQDPETRAISLVVWRLSQEPDDVPVASLHAVFGFAGTYLNGFEAQMSFQSVWLVHTSSIPPDLISKPCYSGFCAQRIWAKDRMTGGNSQQKSDMGKMAMRLALGNSFAHFQLRRNRDERRNLYS